MKIKGFRLKKHMVRFSRWIFYRTTKRHRGYSLLEAPPRSSPKPISKLLSWAGRLTVKTKKSLCSVKPGLGSDYVSVGQEPAKANTVSVPKGHLAVYVGQKDGDFVRILVPVIYFNHPLFGELLREAEEEYGFNHQGGITIPCGVSEFERVKTRIAAGRRCGGSFSTRDSSWKSRC